MEFKLKILKIMRETRTEQFTNQRIFSLFGAKSLFEKRNIEKALKDLVSDGEIKMDKSGNITLLKTKSKTNNKQSETFSGVLQGNQKGFAFFRPENPEDKDLFIPNRNLNGALHLDKVLVELVDKTDESDVARVVEILERGVTKVVGTFQLGNNCGFVVPDDSRYFADIYIPKAKMKQAKTGMKVVANILAFPKGRKNPEGSIIEILGTADTVGCDVLSIVRSHNIKDEFEPETLSEARAIPQTINQNISKDRVDFRNQCIITIDGEDARDLDDAISIDKNADGTFTLGVHIADVTEYVKQDSPLDKEAYSRATSVYFVDRVIPMLPQELSNGICSLNENVDRLTLSCVMTVGSDGQVIESKLCEGVINTRHRMTYTDVTNMIEGDKTTIEKFNDIMPMVNDMDELAHILINRRNREGAIDFDTPEAKIILNDKGEVVEIKQYERKISNRVIEEFMILANRAVASYMFDHNLPFIYRIHEKPKTEKVENFIKFATALGVTFKMPKEALKSKDFADLLGTLEDSPLYLIINRVLLRSMQKAKYSAECIEHFGLSANEYCHFTSPIRRYPDLFGHRMIKMMLHGEFNQNKLDEVYETVSDIANHCSEKERGADEAERDADDLKKAEYMATKLGQEYDGVVSGVTSFGVFVELDNTCEGLARIETLPDDKYEFVESMFKLEGHNHSFKLGDTVKIQVANVDMTTRRVNFAIIEN